MSDQTTERERLASSLSTCADALAVGGAHRAPLRDLQQVAQSLLYRPTDPYVRTIAFLLDEWIKDYYFNFAGDIVLPDAWQKVDEIRQRFLQEQTPRAARRLSDAVKTGATEALVAIEELVVHYLDAIEDANRATSEQ